MTKFLQLISKKLMYFVFFSILIGMLYGLYFPTEIFKPFMRYLIFLMIYPMMINLNILHMNKEIRKNKSLVLSVLINFLISPLLAFVLINIFFAERPEFALGLLLIALIPTSSMTLVWTGLAKGNMVSALLLMSVNLVLSIFFIPLYMHLMLETNVEVNSMAIIYQVIVIVVIPMLLGDITRRMILKKWGKEIFTTKIKPNLSGISSLSVVILIFMTIAAKSTSIIENSDAALLGILVMTIFSILIFFISHIIGNKLLSYKDRIALVYSTATRNLTLSLAISTMIFQDSVLLIATAYIVQVPFATLYFRYSTKKTGTNMLIKFSTSKN